MRQRHSEFRSHGQSSHGLILITYSSPATPFSPAAPGKPHEGGPLLPLREHQRIAGGAPGAAAPKLRSATGHRGSAESLLDAKNTRPLAEVQRLYHDLIWLWEVLSARYPHFILPGLPGKSLASSLTDEKQLLRRGKWFTDALTQLLHDKWGVLSSDRTLFEFLVFPKMGEVQFRYIQTLKGEERSRVRSVGGAGATSTRHQEGVNAREQVLVSTPGEGVPSKGVPRRRRSSGDCDGAARLALVGGGSSRPPRYDTAQLKSLVQTQRGKMRQATAQAAWTSAVRSVVGWKKRLGWGGAVARGAEELSSGPSPGGRVEHEEVSPERRSSSTAEADRSTTTTGGRGSSVEEVPSSPSWGTGPAPATTPPTGSRRVFDHEDEGRAAEDDGRSPQHAPHDSSPFCDETQLPLYLDGVTRRFVIESHYLQTTEIKAKNLVQHLKTGYEHLAQWRSAQAEVGLLADRARCSKILISSGALYFADLENLVLYPLERLARSLANAREVLRKRGTHLSALAEVGAVLEEVRKREVAGGSGGSQQHTTTPHQQVVPSGQQGARVHQAQGGVPQTHTVLGGSPSSVTPSTAGPHATTSPLQNTAEHEEEELLGGSNQITPSSRSEISDPDSSVFWLRLLERETKIVDEIDALLEVELLAFQEHVKKVLDPCILTWEDILRRFGGALGGI